MSYLCDKPTLIFLHDHVFFKGLDTTVWWYGSFADYRYDLHHVCCYIWTNESLLILGKFELAISYQFPCTLSVHVLLIVSSTHCILLLVSLLLEYLRVTLPTITTVSALHTGPAFYSVSINDFQNPLLLAAVSVRRRRTSPDFFLHWHLNLQPNFFSLLTQAKMRPWNVDLEQQCRDSSF